jgi:dTDP-4-amino-4,6-dideoxygalactose transaminase
VKSIPPVDLKRQYQQLQIELNTAVLAVLDSGQYIGGGAVSQFEESFAAYIGTPTCVSCNSGTDALYLALRALNIGSGDEVMTSPFSFIATAEAISMTGATPVFVDIEPHSFNLNPNQIEQSLSPRTKAIIPVHLFGRAVDMTQVMAIAHRHHLFVIEDCAQATGAQWNSQNVGSIGDIGCFSFYPSKNLGGCGDGGATSTHRLELVEQLRLLRDHGRRSGYLHEAVGMNSRLDAIQAAILSVKLNYLEQWNLQRLAIAERYHELLNHVPGIRLPDAAPGSVWNQYTIRVEESGRDRVQQFLKMQGIQSMVYYPVPLHRQPVYETLNYQSGQLPEAERAAREVLSLPMFPELTGAEQELIRDVLKEALLVSSKSLNF